jgi:hypothetical protein
MQIYVASIGTARKRFWPNVKINLPGGSMVRQGVSGRLTGRGILL